MGKLTKFEIELSNPEQAYFAGQEISGKVIIETLEPKKVNEILLELKGRAKTYWTKHSGKSRKHYTNSESYFLEQFNTSYTHKFTITKEGKEKERVLPAGLHEVPFSYTLPKSLPTSFEGEYGYIRYTCKATCERPWDFDIVSRKAFTVIGIEDINAENKLGEPVSSSESTHTVAFCCRSSGSVNGEINLPKSGYTPGESIFVQYRISNTSSRAKQVALKLVQNTTYKAKTFAGHEHVKSVQRVVVRNEKGEVGDSLLDEEDALGDGTSDLVGIAVGSGSSVLEISFSILGDLTRDSDGRATIGDTPAEVIDRTRLMTASQTTQIVLSAIGIVDSHRGQMRPFQLWHGCFDDFESSITTHSLSGEVGVTASSVPFTHRHFGLRVEGDTDSELLSHTPQKVSGHPELVAHADAFTAADLELPLAGSHFRICAEHLEASMKTGSVVRLDNFSSENTISSDSTVVGSLRRRIAVFRPAERIAILVQQQILLFHSEPWLLSCYLLHHFFTGSPMIVLRWLHLGIQRLTENQTVVASEQRIRIDGHRTKKHIRLTSRSLSRRRAIVVPQRILAQQLRNALQRPRLRPNLLSRAVDPDVRSLDLRRMRLQSQKLVDHRVSQWLAVHVAGNSNAKDTWDADTLLIPSVPPRLGKCKVISVNYFVALEVDTLNVELPIVIGSIPQLSDLLVHSKKSEIRGSSNGHVEVSMKSSLKDSPPKRDSPTADVQVTITDECGQLICDEELSTEMESLLSARKRVRMPSSILSELYPTMPSPYYRESSNGAVDISDEKESAQYGEKMFAPKYPFYTD